MDYYNGVVNSDANNVDAISAVLTNSPIPEPTTNQPTC